MRKPLPLLIMLAVTASAATPEGAAAAPPKQPTFALGGSASNGALLMRGTPGAHLNGGLSVRNLTAHTVAVRLLPAVIRNATNGNAQYDTLKPAGDGRWLSLQATTVRLAPRATKRVAFTVSVPKTASGASHYVGVVGVDLADLAPEPASAERADKPSFSFETVNRLAVPITVRLPGPRQHRLSLRSAGIEVVPAGAGLILGLLPEGTELIPSTEVELEVTRGRRSILTHEATLGQLFPGAPLDYRIPWQGRPTEGEYRVVGELRPQGAPPVTVDRTLTFTSDVADELESRTAPPAGAAPGQPLWLWVVLGCASALVIVSLLAVLRMKRRLAATAPSG
jgi:hypothetical protein